MAYSNLQKFYKKEEQRQLMVYLSRRGMICRELKDLTWDKVINGQVLKASLLRKKKIKLSKNLAREIHRLKWQITNSVVPPIKVFYKEMPNEKTGVGGAEFDNLQFKFVFLRE